MAIEMKTCLAMVILGDRQHSASRREDAGEQAAKVSWVGWVGKGIQFVGVRGQLWKGCGRVPMAMGSTVGQYFGSVTLGQYCPWIVTVLSNKTVPILSRDCHNAAPRLQTSIGKHEA